MINEKGLTGTAKDIKDFGKFQTTNSKEYFPELRQAFQDGRKEGIDLAYGDIWDAIDNFKQRKWFGWNHPRNCVKCKGLIMVTDTKEYICINCALEQDFKVFMVKK